MTGLFKAQFVIEASLLLLLALLSFEKTLRKGEKTRLFLVSLLIVSALYIAFYGVCFYASRTVFVWSDAVKIPLILSVIPFFFLFISGIVTGKSRPLRQVLYHLAVPLLFLVAMPVVILAAYLNGIFYDSNVFLTSWAAVGHTFLFAQTMAYTLMFFLKFRVYSRRLQDFYRDEGQQVQIFKYVLISFSAYFLFMDSWMMSMVIPGNIFPVFYALALFATVSVTGWYGMKLEIRPLPSSITQEQAAVEVIQNPAPEPVAGLAVLPADDELKLADDDPDSVKYADIEEEPAVNEGNGKSRRISGIIRKPFDEKQKRALYKRMLNHLITNELYTDPKLTLKQLANDLGTNTRYLSMVINEYQGRNFNQMLNYYRVKKVMRLLVDNEAESYSYLGLAQKAGFHSKSVFIAAFKSQTGTTPSEFSGTMKKLIKS